MPRFLEAKMAYKTREIFAWSCHELQFLELFFQFLHENTNFNNIDVTFFVRIAMCFFQIPLKFQIQISK